MAFSGQYAAAQLHKLDGLLRCQFPLAKEVAEYLGFAPDVVPPTYLAWARARGRLPSMQIWRDQVYVRMYEHELAGYDGIVRARIVRFFGDRLVVTDIHGTFQQVQEVAKDSTPYGYIIHINTAPEDREFFSRWAALYGRAWPEVGFSSIHPALHGANKTFADAIMRWKDRNALQRRIVHQYNRFIPDSDRDERDGGF